MRINFARECYAITPYHYSDRGLLYNDSLCTAPLPRSRVCTPLLWGTSVKYATIEDTYTAKAAPVRVGIVVAMVCLLGWCY